MKIIGPSILTVMTFLSLPSSAFFTDTGHCAVLEIAPESTNPMKQVVVFAGASADYFFSGFAEVATLNGIPIPNTENKVIFAVQSIKIPTQTGTRYLAIGSIDLDFSNNHGTVQYEPPTRQLLEDFPQAPPTKFHSSLLKTYPRSQCLSDAQFDWTKW